jgi:hypothetical protein
MRSSECRQIRRRFAERRRDGTAAFAVGAVARRTIFPIHLATGRNICGRKLDLPSSGADVAEEEFDWRFPAPATQIIWRNTRIRVLRVIISGPFLNSRLVLLTLNQRAKSSSAGRTKGSIRTGQLNERAIKQLS